MATRPRSPEPGSTNRPSSVMTLVDSLNVKPLAVPPLDDDADDAMPTASDDPSVSMQRSRALCFIKPALVSAAHHPPKHTSSHNDEMSHRSGAASSSRRIGLAKASPTMY